MGDANRCNKRYIAGDRYCLFFGIVVVDDISYSRSLAQNIEIQKHEMVIGST